MNAVQIGDQYLTRGKRKDLCTVVDVLKTYNSKGELVQTRYICEYDYLGQTMFNRSVTAVTILRGKELLKEAAK